MPLNNIERISGESEGSADKARDASNVALIAHLNRVIFLREPIGGRRFLFMRLDGPAAFDAALGVCLPAR